MDKTLALLEALLSNIERYGYMACPCRLAKEDREADKDIICPCAYREADIQEYGSCYCGLYVSQGISDSCRISMCLNADQQRGVKNSGTSLLR